MKSSTDVQTQQVYGFLLNKAFVPYCDMLNQWIYHGIIDDSYEEFLIKERKDIVKENINKEFRDNYWEKRFILKEDQVFFFNLHFLNYRIDSYIFIQNGRTNFDDWKVFECYKRM